MCDKTLRRQRQDGESSDSRPDAVHPLASHSLTQEKKLEIIDNDNKPKFASQPPAQIATIVQKIKHITSEGSSYYVNKTHNILKL